MTAAGQFRVLALGAAFVLGLGGMAEAKSHASHSAHQGGHGPTVHATGRAAPSGRHFGKHADAMPIVFSAGRHAGQRFAMERIVSPRGGHSHGGRVSYARYASYSTGHSSGGLQCVTFARADSGIELSGNANTWWDNAAGVYQRGARPEAGSVLNFRANGSMRMGHVAVVNQVVNSRTIEIDHANWGGPGAVRGGISRDISVVDVSPNNDWSAVRVGLGHSGEYGSIYPTFGFIYNRPDRGMMVASNDRSAPMPALNPAPRDLRGGMLNVSYDEVAEAPDSPVPTMTHRLTRHGHRASVIPSRHHSATASRRHHR